MTLEIMCYNLFKITDEEKRFGITESEDNIKMYSILWDEFAHVATNSSEKH